MIKFEGYTNQEEMDEFISRINLSHKLIKEHNHLSDNLSKNSLIRKQEIERELNGIVIWFDTK